MPRAIGTDAGVRRTARVLAWTSLAVALPAAVVGAFPGYLPLASALLGGSIVLLGGAAFVLGWRPPGVERVHEPDEERFVRELVTHANSLILYVVFLLLLLMEAITIPAALGYLRFFGAFAISFIQFFPGLLLVVHALLVGALLHHAKAPGRAPHTAWRRTFAVAGAASAGLFALLALAVQAGLLGLHPDRAVFVLAGGFIGLFFFVHAWTRMPSYDEVTHWLETEERLRHTDLLHHAVFALLALSVVGLAATFLAAVGVLPRPAGLIGLGAAMLAIIPATFSVGVKRYVAKLHAGEELAGERRQRARVILRATSVGLTVLVGALATATFLAFLAQVGDVRLFRALLTLFVEQYPVILGLALVPVIAAIVIRTRVESEELYSDARKAMTLFAALFTIVLAFFGIFIGSGMARGTGIEIENAVLAMSGAAIALIVLVENRALLPGVVGMIRESVHASRDADKELREDIQRRMIATYVAALLFVVGFVAYAATSTLGVLPAPGEGLATDVALFAFVLVGLAIFVLVVMRYLQGVNIDPRWKRRQERETEIGKRRLTAQELQRYIILGFSFSAAGILAAIGILVQLQIVKNVGSLAVERKFATDFFVFAILLGIGPYGYYHMRELKRVNGIDQKFPEFLRDLAESQRAGMTLTEAVMTASKGNYGQLTPEVRKMAAQIEWGVSFQDALERFAKRVRTPLIDRTVALVVQAAASGGNVVDVLSAAANDSREIQMILKERKGSMAIYTMIIYVAFLVFMGVVAILTAQFIPEVSKAVSKAEGISIGGLNFRAIDEQAFRSVFFHAALIQGLGGGLVAGVMEGGKPVAGLKHCVIMISMAYVVFRFFIGG